jgi:1-acyl-sn-glycerol-3-phosphate acyltransferase
MISDLIYRCPVCGGFDWLADGGCIHCGVTLEIHSRAEVSVNGRKEGIPFWYGKVLSFPLPANDKGVILQSGKIRLSEEAADGLYKGFLGMIATHYLRRPIDEGQLTLFEKSLVFSGSKEELKIGFDSITSLTIESHTLIVVSRVYGPLFFDFLEESGKKWEDCIQKAVSQYHTPRKIIEFCPRIRFAEKTRPVSRSSSGPRVYRLPVRRWFRKDSSLLFKTLRLLVRLIVRLIFTVRIEGAENIPKKGSAILMSNHVSFLDAIILGMFFPRHIWFMTKNSQFYGSFLFWGLPKTGAFPVRRYTTDPQAVRNLIRVVQAGHIAGVFPEGERSWDGEMLPFKSGCMRMILCLNQPVIPVGISGGYELMPRWTAKVKRVPVKVRIGPPIRFKQVPLSEQTEEVIEETENRVKEQIRALAKDD